MRLHTQSSVKYDRRAALSITTSCSMHDGEATLTKAVDAVRQLQAAASAPITQPVCNVPFAFGCHLQSKTCTYPVMRGSVLVETRASGGLSLSMSQMVY